MNIKKPRLVLSTKRSLGFLLLSSISSYLTVLSSFHLDMTVNSTAISVRGLSEVLLSNYINHSEIVTRSLSECFFK